MLKRLLPVQSWNAALASVVAEDVFGDVTEGDIAGGGEEKRLSSGCVEGAGGGEDMALSSRLVG